MTLFFTKINLYFKDDTKKVHTKFIINKST